MVRQKYIPHSYKDRYDEVFFDDIHKNISIFVFQGFYSFFLRDILFGCRLLKEWVRRIYSFLENLVIYFHEKCSWLYWTLVDILYGIWHLRVIFQIFVHPNAPSSPYLVFFIAIIIYCHGQCQCCCCWVRHFYALGNVTSNHFLATAYYYFSRVANSVKYFFFHLLFSNLIKWSESSSLRWMSEGHQMPLLHAEFY